MRQESSRPVLIAAGGTGGHVFPALVVAYELQNKGVPLLWVGTQRGIESTVVPQAGIDIVWMDVKALRGKGGFELFLAPFRLLRALASAVFIVMRHKPRVVLGMGGFVAGPIGLAARIVRVPLVLHEQNAIPGMTNRVLSKIATQVLQAFPGAFPPAVGATTVGNPIRKEIVSVCEEKSGDEALNLLIVGGSLGAKFFNDTLPRVVSQSSEVINVLHQTGKGNSEAVRGLYRKYNAKENVEVRDFIDDMSEAYGWSDLVICRSGAMTVSELAACGKPALFVPFPHAVDDHQTQNAMFLVEADAARIVQQHDADIDKLVSMISDLSDKALLKAMGERAKAVAVLNAGERVADELMRAAA